MNTEINYIVKEEFCLLFEIQFYKKSLSAFLSNVIKFHKSIFFLHSSENKQVHNINSSLTSSSN